MEPANKAAVYLHLPAERVHRVRVHVLRVLRVGRGEFQHAFGLGLAKGEIDSGIDRHAGALGLRAI